MRDEFLLDREVTFLNHGSFGACPRRVFERYQWWQRELEREPVEFIARRLPDLLAGARAELAAYLGAAPGDLTFVGNATTGVNMAARSLDLGPGDEVLTTDLEYGACVLAWGWVCAHTGARLVQAPISIPPADDDAIVEQLFAARTERTRAVFVSHITSATALVLPVEEIVRRARAEGLVSIVDGAHAPAHVALELDALGADFYSGTCHKWLCAPKGAGFLHVRPEHQERVDGPIVSWGYEAPDDFRSRTSRQGTRDPAAYLAVPEAIAFQREHGWDEVRERCVALCLEARADLCRLLDTEPLAPDRFLRQMASVRLPQDEPDLRDRLFAEHRIDVPVVDGLLRLSVAAYTLREDIERLLDVLPRVLSRRSRSPASS